MGNDELIISEITAELEGTRLTTKQRRFIIEYVTAGYSTLRDNGRLIGVLEGFVSRFTD